MTRTAILYVAIAMIGIQPCKADPTSQPAPPAAVQPAMPPTAVPVQPAPPAPPMAPDNALPPDPDGTTATDDTTLPIQPTKFDDQFYTTPNYISALAFSRTSDHVVVGLKDGRIGFFSMAKRIFSPWSDSFNPSGIDAIAISPNSDLIAVGTSDAFVQLLSAKSLTTIKNLHIGTNDADGVLDVAFSADGTMLAACAEADPGDFSKPRGEVCVWSIKSGARVCHFYTSTQNPRSVAFSSDSSRLLVGGVNPTVWDVPHDRIIRQISNNSDYPAAISPDGEYVAMTADGGIFDLKDQTLQTCSLGALNTIMYTSDGRYLIGGGGQDGWSVFDGKTGKKLVDLEFPDDFGAISPDGQYVAASSYNLGLDIVKVDIPTWTTPSPD